MMDKFLCKFRDNFINEKEFLSLDDVCYIFNKNGGDFHIDSEQQHEAERDYNRLKSVLYDLVTHNRITPVVCFDGKYEPYSYTAILETDINEIGETITIEREKQILNDGLYPKTDYIYLPRIYFKRLFTTNRNIQLSPLDNLTFYRYPPSEQLGDRYFKFYAYKNFKINPDSYIWFNDLCYPKEQILALFGAHKIKADNAELVQQLQAEIAKIKQEKLEAIQGYKDAYSDYLEKYKQEVSVLKGHLEQQAQDKQATIDSQAKEIADLKAQLEQQATQPSDTATGEDKNSRNQDDKLIVAMALLLSEKSKQFKRGNKPNASQIGIAINSIADFMLDIDDKYGLTTPDQRIRKALNNISELIKNS